MSMASLVADLKVSLSAPGKALSGPDDADDSRFRRFLVDALPDMQLKRPRTQLGSLGLEANRPRYSLSNCPMFAGYKAHLWGDTRPMPWEPGYPGALPRVDAVYLDDGWWLNFDPAPTWKHIGALGATFRFWYYGRHVLGADAADTTISMDDRGLLLLRAQVEAMRELAIRNAGKAVQVRDGLSGTPRNSTPVALHTELMRIFKRTR